MEMKAIKNIFTNCKSLISLPDISKWNLINIEDKSYINNLFDSSIKSDKNSLYQLSSTLNNNSSNSGSTSFLNTETKDNTYYENIENTEIGETSENFDYLKISEYYEKFYD